MPVSARARTALGTLFLLAVAAAVAGVAYFGVHLRGQELERKELDGKRVLDVDPEEVTALRVVAKGDDVRLVRADGAWRVTAPIEARADAAQVRSLLDRLASLERRSVSASEGASPDTLRRYGLDQPDARIEVTLAGGRTERLLLGDTTGFDGAMFVMPTDGRVIVVAGEARGALEQGLYELRDKRLLPVEEADVVRLEVKAPALAYALERGDGGWRIARPVAEPADQGAVSRILLALRELRAAAFLPADAPRIERPRYEIRVRTRDGRTRALTASEPEGDDVRVRVEGGEAARVSAGALAALDQDLFALREKRLFPELAADAVAGVRFEGGGAPFEVRRAPAAKEGEPDAWRLVEPREAPAQSVRLAGLVYGLASLEAAALVDEKGAALARSGLAPARRTVVLRGKDGQELARLLVGAEANGRVHVKTGASPRVWAVDADRLAALPGSADEVVEQPTTPPPEGREGG